MKKRVLSGMRPTGRLHLGNYLGAAKGMLALQEDSAYETIYTVVDVHALTTPFNPGQLREDVFNVVLDYLAIGLDPEKSSITIQSDLAEYITQLAFYFSAVVSVARMQHLPTFKDKVKQYPEHATMALLNYPLLMAADILVYKAAVVPVGIDQEPHLEIAREVARKMNTEYGLQFPEPQRFATTGEYIPSLLGEGKMSKTVEGSAIDLSDDLPTIQHKLSRVPTDSGKGTITGTSPAHRDSSYVSAEDGLAKPGVKSLLHFVELFEGKATRQSYESQYQGSGIRYGELKKQLAEAIYSHLEPIQKKRLALAADPGYVKQVIAKGKAEAQAIAHETLVEVRQALGLQPPERNL